MRTKLKDINGIRMRFSAIVERFGLKNGWKGAEVETILLKNVFRVDTGEVVADHLWFTKGSSWNKCIPGSIVEFDARVTLYEKGYKGYREDIWKPIKSDYKLERPTKVKIIKQ